VIPIATTVITKMKVWMTQTGSGTFTIGIYDSSFNLLRTTSALSGSTGLISGNLTSSIQLTAGNLYYFAVAGNINGCAMLGITNLFISNPPIIAKQDINASTLSDPFTGGSSTDIRIWIGAYSA